MYTTLAQPSTTVYEALSYCWGDHRERKEITVRVPGQDGGGEHIVHFTSALHTALKRLR
ncbi:hypothetical protein F4775DRAFT_552550 [Biscogniauxia sp. FL1348]|nr:hypothetical protein F4775DRAFT_552550 [Biscogniauxia sp. FL1348]